LADDDLDAVNTRDHPDRVTPSIGAPPSMDGPSLEVVLPPVSWNVLRMESVQT
jgi:alpha-N-arabinofuranosidase